MQKQKEILVEVQPRSDVGKNESRRMRALGRVPGVVYGGDRPVVAIAVEQRRVLEILRSETGENTLFTLQLEGTDSKRVVMIRDYQRDPVKGKLLHVDFVRVDLTKAIEVRVPVHVTGIPVGVKLEGGLLDHVVREVSVSCLPGDIPEALELDASEVHVGQHLSIRDIKVTDKVKILDDPDQTVIVVAMPKAEEVAATPAAEGAPAEAAAAEPEVIKKGKEAAGDDEPAAKAGDAKKPGGEGKKKEGGKG
jgi:large subunit ribosomal protein L25